MRRSFWYVLALSLSSSCPAFPPAIIYSGGVDDGFSNALFKQAPEIPYSPPVRFSGGGGDGFSFKDFLQNPEDPYRNPSRFSGSALDGYSQASFLQNPIVVYIPPKRFSGSVKDGYSWSGAINGGLISTSSPRFSGGGMDGYSLSYFWQLGPTGPPVFPDRFNGGPFDGAAQIYFIQSDDALENYEVRFVGGFGDGYAFHAKLNLSNPLDADTDQDGLPDWWELPNFGGITNAHPLEDTDLDGFSDGDEFYADTDPNQTLSYLGITEVKRVGNDVLVEWKGGKNSYQYLSIRNPHNPNDNWETIWTNTPPTQIDSSIYLTDYEAPSLLLRIEAGRNQ